MVYRKRDPPKTYGTPLGVKDRMGREYRKMPRRGMGFRGVVVILIIPVDGIMKVEVSSPFVEASRNLHSIGVCRFRGSFLFEPFCRYPILLPLVIIPSNLGRTASQLTFE